MKKEFLILEDKPIDVQKKVRQWVSTGYKIEIVAQNLFKVSDEYKDYILIVSLWRWKEK
jgi:hypothetical protein